MRHYEAPLLPEQSAPGTPASGFVAIYPKSDGLWYGKDDAGVETALSGGGGGGTPPYSATIGNGSSTSIVVTHGLGTRDVAVVAYMVASPYNTLDVNVERTSTTTVTLIFAVAPATNSVRVLVFNQAVTTVDLTVSGKGYVNHGSTAATARPSGYASIEWYGSVQPDNWIAGDTWVDTS